MSGSLEDRVRRILAVRPESPSPAQATSGPDIVRVPITCGVTGRPFIGIAELRPPVALLVGNELPGGGTQGVATTSPAARLGSYRFEARADWCCPICLTRDSSILGGSLVWQCGCSLRQLHCVGSDPSGRTWCACGKYEHRSFTLGDAFEVHGARNAPASTMHRPTAPAPAPVTTAVPPSPAARRPAVAPSSAPRLPGKR